MIDRLILVYMHVARRGPGGGQGAVYTEEDPRDDVVVTTSFLGSSYCCTAVVAKALRWSITVGRE